MPNDDDQWLKGQLWENQLSWLLPSNLLMEDTNQKNNAVQILIKVRIQTKILRFKVIYDNRCNGTFVKLPFNSDLDVLMMMLSLSWTPSKYHPRSFRVLWCWSCLACIMLRAEAQVFLNMLKFQNFFPPNISFQNKTSKTLRLTGTVASLSAISSTFYSQDFVLNIQQWGSKIH